MAVSPQQLFRVEVLEAGSGEPHLLGFWVRDAIHEAIYADLRTRMLSPFSSPNEDFPVQYIISRTGGKSA